MTSKVVPSPFVEEMVNMRDEVLMRRVRGGLVKDASAADQVLADNFSHEGVYGSDLPHHVPKCIG